MKMMESAGLFSEDVDAVPDTAVSAAAPEVPPETVADKDAMLSPEHIGHMLSVLGDDIIGDMLESAGLSDEDVDAVLAEAKAESKAAEAENGTAAPDDGKRSAPPGKRRKGRNVRRLLFVLIFIGILGLVAAVNKIYNSVTINSNDPIQYSEHTDMISADEGTLHVNNVSVTVPTDGTEEYSISYSWAENDSKYPSVPHAITVIYPKRSEVADEAEIAGNPGIGAETDKDAAVAEEPSNAEKQGSAFEEKPAGADKEDVSTEEPAADAEKEATEAEKNTEKLYSITLYRNETTPFKEVEKGKNADNWFDDWTVVKEGDVLQIPLKSGSINGFYIFPQPPEDNGPVSDYNDYSYYFAIEDDGGISTYVIEGVCLDPEYDDEFRSIMDNCIHSISIEQEAEAEVNEDNIEEPDTEQ